MKNRFQQEEEKSGAPEFCHAGAPLFSVSSNASAVTVILIFAAPFPKENKH